MYRHVLAAVDVAERDVAGKVLAAALRFIDGDETTLHVLTVVPDAGMPLVGQYLPEDAEKKIRDEGLDALKALVAANVPSGVNVQHVVYQGRIYSGIISAAEKINADLIVVGGHAPSVVDAFLGPNAARVVRYASQSVLVVRD